MRREYRVKEKKDEPVPMQVDSEKAPAAKVVQVEDGKGKAQDAQEGPVIIEKPATFLRSLCWPMIMRPAAATPMIKTRRSTSSLGGAHRG